MTEPQQDPAFRLPEAPGDDDPALLPPVSTPLPGPVIAADDTTTELNPDIGDPYSPSADVGSDLDPLPFPDPSTPDLTEEPLEDGQIALIPTPALQDVLEVRTPDEFAPPSDVETTVPTTIEEWNASIPVVVSQEDVDLATAQLDLIRNIGIIGAPDSSPSDLNPSTEAMQLVLGVDQPPLER